MAAAAAAASGPSSTSGPPPPATTGTSTTAAHAGSAPAPAAAAAAAPRTGLLDLEKELSCSICADTLYQPLTLLDCLHTFCGSCLKLWFAWQLTQVDADQDANDAHLRNPYTCPSCRAHVRGTRPDAKITTLLDMFLAANPGKGKSEEDKKEMREKYTPGDDVVPRLSESLEDVKLARDARFMRLSEENRARRAHGGYQRGVRHQAGDRSRREGDGSDRARAQHLGHQSSLRSLMSMDDIDSAEMEEEIMRQIVEEGLLDGIDLADLSNGQVDELGERIAEAYRARHTIRRRSRRRSSDSHGGEGRGEESPRRLSAPRSRDASRRRSSSRRRNPSPPAQERRTQGQNVSSASQDSGRSPAQSPAQSPAHSPARSNDQSPGRSSGGRNPGGRSPGRAHASSDARAPIQRSDLLQAYPAEAGRRRRSSEARRQTAPVEPSAASRSATDLSTRPENAERPRHSSRVGSGSDVPPHRLVLRDSPGSRSPQQGSPVQSPVQSPGFHALRTSSRTSSLTAASVAPSVVPFEHSTDQHPILASSASYHPNAQVTAPSFHRRASSFSNTMPGVSRLQGFPEPIIDCDRCGKSGIQYDIHHNCQICKSGKFNICDRCYKAGRGCDNWYGFGHMAWRRYQQKGAPSHQLPHVLLGSKYRRPEANELTENSTETRLLAKDPAQKRRRVGAYCYVCSEYAEDFFYKCDSCNDGEWGYCRNCVNKGRCCTHPLLPIAWVKSNRFKSSPSDAAKGVQATFAPMTNQDVVQPFPPSTIGATRQYRPLTVSTTCDRCKCSISPTTTRFHCPKCNDGWLELCAPCYSQLQDIGSIAPEDGISGWRRCPRGHRMIITAFQDSDQGQRRFVLCDLVGGHFLKDESEHSASSPTSSGNDSGVHATLGSRSDERRYNWQDGDTGRSMTLTRPRTSSVVLGGGGGGSGGNGNGNSKFPPDGGVGKRCVARWSWIPEDGVTNELLFPRGAELTEVLDVNNEWCEGSYAGSKGVFPTSYVKMIEFVSM